MMKRMEEMKSTVHNQSEMIVALEQRLSNAERRVDGVDQRTPGDRRDSKFTNFERELSLIKTQVELLRTSRSGLMATSSSYTTDVTTGAGSIGGAPSLQQFEALNSKVTELDHSLDRCLSTSLDQELRLQLLERATYNGILLWKIDDFSRRKREAVDGVTLSLYSTPFYTSRHGYKMCARIYLNGDGLGKGTHLSFFFVIMRGPFDALLTWPFKQKVMLTLINQTGKKHVTDHFRPDPQSSSFQRPGRKEMNIASGCPMFIRIDHLMTGGFIKDDSIFLRIVVDTADLPRIIP